jgi:hypothetical protein
MRLKYAALWCAKFNLVLRSYPEIQTFWDGRHDHATSSGYVECVLDFAEKLHRHPSSSMITNCEIAKLVTAFLDCKSLGSILLIFKLHSAVSNAKFSAKPA